MITIALAWQPSALPQKTQQLDGARPVTCSQGEASLLSAGPEQQMLGMNISGIPSPHCATISMNQMWRAKIFTSCVSGGSRLHTLATSCVIDTFGWTGLYFLLLLKRFGYHCLVIVVSAWCPISVHGLTDALCTKHGSNWHFLISLWHSLALRG